MVLLLTIVKALAEIAVLALAGQLVIALFNPARRAQNPVYQLLGVVTAPVKQLARLIAPKSIAVNRLSLVSFFLLVLVWSCATAGKIYFLRVAPL
jgi:hypothetical protein